MLREIRVNAIFDPEAGVWYTESPDIHGLRIEAATLEALIERIPGAIRDLLECEDDGDCEDVPISLVAHARTSVRVGMAA